MKQILHEAP